MSGVLQKDDNGYPVSGGVSSSDPKVVLNSQIDDITGRLLVDASGGVTSGSGAPSSIPSGLGQIYIDTTGSKVYISTGTTNSGSWSILN